MPRSRPRSGRRAADADYLAPIVRTLSDPAELATVRTQDLEPLAFQLALYFGTGLDGDAGTVLNHVYARLVAEVTT